MAAAGKTAIPALTGLRFIAAACVLFSHGILGFVPVHGTPPLWYDLVSTTSAEGMSLFFILSGFVIHYNYSVPIARDRVRGIYNFLVARFARLYPLYILGICSWIVIRYFGNQLPPATADALPYYASMTQAWFYLPMAGSSLIYQFWIVAQVAWSVSTEWFFYLVYPGLLLVISGLRSPRQLLLAAVILCTAAYAAVIAVLLHLPAIDQLAVTHFGDVASLATHRQDSFVRWLIYFSPYARIPEFVLGCLCAALYVGLSNQPVSLAEQRCGLLLTIASLTGTGVLHWVMFGPANVWPGSWHLITWLHMNFGFAPFLTLLIFCCARYDNAIVRLLTHPVVLNCGEASYSLYLLHPAVLDVFRYHLSPLLTAWFGVWMLMQLAIASALAVAVSLLSWKVIEMPARRWLRQKLTISGTARTVDDPGAPPNRFS